MRNISDKACRENQNTQFIFNNFSFSENPAVPEILWKDMVQSDRPQVELYYGACAFHAGSLRIKNAHSSNLISIAFPLQKWVT
jgi:hypothetical protein